MPLTLSDDLRRTQQVLAELHALKTALADHEDRHHRVDSTGRVLRQMIADRRRVVHTLRVDL